MVKGRKILGWFAVAGIVAGYVAYENYEPPPKKLMPEEKAEWDKFMAEIDRRMINLPRTLEISKVQAESEFKQFQASEEKKEAQAKAAAAWLKAKKVAEEASAALREAQQRANVADAANSNAAAVKAAVDQVEQADKAEAKKLADSYDAKHGRKPPE